MSYVPPKLTDEERFRLKIAIETRERMARKASDTAEEQLASLEEEYQRRRRDILDELKQKLDAAKNALDKTEDEIFSAIFEEESRTGKKRPREPLNL